MRVMMMKRKPEALFGAQFCHFLSLHFFQRQFYMLFYQTLSVLYSSLISFENYVIEKFVIDMVHYYNNYSIIASENADKIC